MEILSPSTADRDRGLKRRLYEKFGVREYWIVDPGARTVEVLRPTAGRLETAEILREGDRLKTPLLPGLQIELASVFAGE